MIPQTRPKAPVLIFDIETIPDIELISASYTHTSTPSENSDLWKDLDYAGNLSEELGKKVFPPLYNMVLSICAVFLDPETKQICDGFKKTIPPNISQQQFLQEEKKMLAEFWEFCGKYRNLQKVWYDSLLSEFKLSDYMQKKLKPIPLTFCGYNITGFDLPVLEQRSIKHLLSCPIPEYAIPEGTDSYRYKFASDKIYDLCDFVANFQPQNRIGLNALSRSMGLGGKMKGMDGSQVAHVYFLEHDSRRIEDYCAVDVLITYGTYLAIEKFRGKISESHFSECVHELKNFLERPKSPSAYKELLDSSPTFFFQEK